MPEAERRPATARHLSHDDVVHLVGDVEDATVAAILTTGANYEEVEQALKWAGAGLDEPRLNSHGMTPRAEQIFDILLSDPAYAEEEEGAAR